MSLLHQLALTFISGIGDTTAKSMVIYCGGAAEVFKTPKAKLLKIPGVGEKTAAQIFHHREAFIRAEAEMLFIERNAIRMLFFTDKDYPKRLTLCEDAPVLLFYKGNADLNNSRIINIVGTRKATEYGKGICNKLIDDLKAYGVVVVSGLAYGIDFSAHKACLKQEIPTIGVLGHGLDRIYPAPHAAIAEKMLDQGGLLTEFPSATIPDRENFPKRNRIIAGMADATIVVEASIKGGALITAEIANSYNRDVFAFPGRIGDEFSEGCNYLIRNNKAVLITGTADLSYILGWSTDMGNVKKKQQLVFPIDLSVDEKLIFDHLQIAGQIGIDDLAFQTKMPVSMLAMNLLSLEMQGFIRSLPGKTYSLVG